MLRRLKASILATALVAGSGMPAMADWQTENDKAQTAFDAKDWASAENAAVAALNEAESFPAGDERRIATMRLLARVYQQTRQWAAAAPLFEQILAMYAEKGTDQSPEAGNTQNDVGIVYVKLRQLSKAEDAFNASLKIKRKKYKQNLASIALVLSNLGELYRQQGKWKEAEELHRQAITDKENELGPDHPSLVTSLNNLAIVLRETKRGDESVPFLERAIAIGEAAAKADPDERPNYATALHNFGDYYSNKRDFDKARPLYEKALKLRREALGNDHPWVAETLNNLANMLVSQDKAAEALPLFDEAITIRTNEFGATDQRVTKVMMNKAMALDRLGKKDEAQKLRDEAKAADEKRKSGGN